jgi:hypothetical protein
MNVLFYQKHVLFYVMTVFRANTFEIGPRLIIMEKRCEELESGCPGGD